MRREIVGIFLFFFVVFTLMSLLSSTPRTPRSTARGPGAGARTSSGGRRSSAGALIGLFGIGAFSIPILLLLGSLHVFGDQPLRVVMCTLAGGLLLILTTGGLLALHQDHYLLFERRFSAGGLLGIPLKAVLVRYTNPAGGVIILAVLWLVGFILATGFSVLAFFRRCRGGVGSAYDNLLTAYLKGKERRERSQRVSQADHEKFKAKAKEVKVAPAAPKPVKIVPPPKQEVFEFMQTGRGFHLPPFSLLEDPDPRQASTDSESLRVQSKLLEKKLEDFGVNGQVVAVSPGPVVTTYEYEPAPGVKINKVANLSDDLALALRATSIRIVAPIPGKAAIGIEVPNAVREMVKFKEVVASSAFEKSKSKLTLCLGKDIVGVPVAAELDKMPHLLIAGATGTGKSVALNGMICSLLYKARPDEVKLIMVDPKRIELLTTTGCPPHHPGGHATPEGGTNALYWAVREMERRYERLSERKARNIKQYNQKLEAEKAPAAGGDSEKLPYIVIIIDELADLMMVASREVEEAITRLAQMARAPGSTSSCATQRPSVDVLTGIIKANFPTRLTFRFRPRPTRAPSSTPTAPRTCWAAGTCSSSPAPPSSQRIHGPFISEGELGASSSS